LSTVITNLLSAIPWVGQDIVEFVLGGLCRLLLIEEPFNSDIVMQILLIAGISINLDVVYGCGFMLSSIPIGVKITTTRGRPAGVRSKSTCSEASQRLNAGDLIFGYIVGLIEGDGFFSVSKAAGKYISYELGIELGIKDVQLIYKIKDILGIGIVSFRERDSVKMVSLRIRNKSHLINYILPIFDKYPLISNKQYDYLRFREALLSGITFYEDLPKYTRPSTISPLNCVESILSIPYFSA
jgi:hypothetical protein